MTKKSDGKRKSPDKNKKNKKKKSAPRGWIPESLEGSYLGSRQRYFRSTIQDWYQYIGYKLIFKTQFLKKKKFIKQLAY